LTLGIGKPDIDRAVSNAKINPNPSATPASHQIGILLESDKNLSGTWRLIDFTYFSPKLQCE